MRYADTIFVEGGPCMDAYKVLHIPTGLYVKAEFVYFLGEHGSIFLDKEIMYDDLILELEMHLRESITPMIKSCQGLYNKIYDVNKAEFIKIDIILNIDKADIIGDFDTDQIKLLYYDQA